MTTVAVNVLFPAYLSSVDVGLLNCLCFTHTLKFQIQIFWSLTQVLALKNTPIFWVIVNSDRLDVFLFVCFFFKKKEMQQRFHPFFPYMFFSSLSKPGACIIQDATRLHRRGIGAGVCYAPFFLPKTQWFFLVFFCLFVCLFVFSFSDLQSSVPTDADSVHITWFISCHQTLLLATQEAYL